jgi:UDP-glucose 4-epimerase
MSIKVLISGGTGYIGSVLSHHLYDHKIDFAAIDNLSNSSLKFYGKEFIFYKGNINNFSILEKIYQKFRPTHIVHLAASIDVKESEIRRKKYYYNNVINSKRFINFFIKKKVKNYIFSSTAAVYNLNSNKKREIYKQIPANYYGNTKLLIEKFLLKKKSKNRLNIKILRFFNVVGADKKLRTGNISKRSKHLFNSLSKSTFFNKTFNINGKNYKTKDGTCIRDFVDVNDLVKIIIFFIKNKNNHTIFNIGTNKGYSVLQTLKFFEKTLKVKIFYRYIKNRIGDAPNLVCNNFLLKRIYNFNFINFRSSIKSHYNFYKKNYDSFI